MDDELIDDLVEEITVDAYGHEGYWAFLTALEDVLLLPAKGQGRRPSGRTRGDRLLRRRAAWRLTAVVRRGNRRWTASVLDLELPQRSKAARHLVACRRVVRSAAEPGADA